MNTPSTHPAMAGSMKPTGGSSSAPAAGAVQKRLQTELMQLMMAGNKDISAFPEGDNMFEWAATLKGPAGSAYEGMTFKLKLKFPADYPFTSPTVTFTTPVYHPNVDNFGNICLDILKDKWTPAYSVSTVLLSLQALLQDANVASPLNGPAAQLWPDLKAFKAKAVKTYNDATGSNLVA